MKKTILIVLLSLFVVFSATAESESVFDEFDQAVGGFYGMVGGQGISYQQWFDTFGLETAAGFSYYGGDTFDFNIGAQAQFMLYKDSFGDWFTGGLYAWGGGLYGALVGQTSYVPAIGLGAGIGLEAVFFEHFSIPIEFGYGGSWGFDSIVPKMAGVRIQGGLRYRF